jgi:hypothetical protein
MRKWLFDVTVTGWYLIDLLRKFTASLAGYHQKISKSLNILVIAFSNSKPGQGRLL